MCRICAEYELGKLTRKEARRNLGEVTPKTSLEENHLNAVTRQLNLDDEIDSFLTANSPLMDDLAKQEELDKQRLVDDGGKSS